MGQARKVITFTSDRPGVGQTMALSSIALLFATNGRRVLAIDWDMVKPSLAGFFAPLLSSHALENNDGLIDIVWTYSAAVRRGLPADLPELKQRIAQCSPIECSIPDGLRIRRGGVLHLLSAGREPRRNVRVKYFNWGEFFDRLDGDDFLKKLLEDVMQRYDHILVDCPHPGQATRFPVLNADILVSCFTLDDESAQAGAATVRWASQRLPNRRLIVYPLPMRVDRAAEAVLLRQALEAVPAMYSELEGAVVLPTDLTKWQIPLVPLYTYQRALPPLVETLPLFTRDICKFAAALADQSDIEWNEPTKEQVSDYLLVYREAAKRQTKLQLQVASPYLGHEAHMFVSYARDDRDAVMPVLQELSDLEWRLWWDEEIPGGADWHAYLTRRIKEAQNLLVFVSAASNRSNWVAEEIRLARDLGKPILSIRLDWSEVPKETLSILDRYQMLDHATANFPEQLGRAMNFLQEAALDTTKRAHEDLLSN